MDEKPAVLDFNVQPVVRRARYAEHIATCIEGEILSGRLQSGARLPTEHLLSENFGVSRNVVREAIATLRSQGLIESIQGLGIFVTNREQTAPVVENAPAITVVPRDPNVRNMFEVRAALESQAAALAASRMTAERLAKIRAAVVRMQDLDAPTSETVDADLSFHRAVAEAADNSYLSMSIGMLLEPMRLILASEFSKPGPVFGKMPHEARTEHEVLLQAFVDRNPRVARTLMGQHIAAAASRFGYEITYV